MRPGEPAATRTTERSVLEVDGLVAGYGGHAVLHEVTFEVRAREVVVLTGPNGSGKSTLVRAITGHAEVMRGEVRVDGRALPRRGFEVCRSGVACVPDSHHVLTGMSVRQNLALGAGRSATTDPGLRPADPVETALDHFPVLRSRLDQAAGTLSGGERRMLGIARAMTTDPRFLLLDEPSTGLDQGFFDAWLDSIASLARDRWMGVLLVEQERSAVRVADVRLELDSGVLRPSDPGGRAAGPAGAG